MKRYTSIFRWLSVCIFLVATNYSFAGDGLYIEQTKLTGNGTPTGSTVTMFLYADKFRMEESGSITIGRLDRAEIWYFDTNDRTYFEMPVMASDTSGVEVSELFTRTGRTRTIGEWKCHEVVLNTARRAGWFEAIDSLTIWISDKSYSEAATYFASIFQAIGIDREQLGTIQENIGNGFPIEVELNMLGSSSRLRVIKIEPRTFSSVQFEPIPGYTKQSMDLFPEKIRKNH